MQIADSLQFFYKINKEQLGATTLNINGHAFCVVDSDENSILIQEYYLTEVYKNNLELIPNTFPPTYKISKEQFNSQVESFGVIKWN